MQKITRTTLDKIIGGREIVKIAKHDNSQKTISTRLMVSYHGPSSVAFAKNLKKTFATMGFLNVSFTTSKLKSHLGGSKASVPKPLRSHLVYKISCSTCCGTYVGQTVRQLEVGQHLLQCGTSLGCGNVRFFATEQNPRSLFALEGSLYSPKEAGPQHAKRIPEQHTESILVRQLTVLLITQ